MIRDCDPAPRVDPTEVLATDQGEVAAIRNVGGRVTPETLMELAMLSRALGRPGEISVRAGR